MAGRLNTDWFVVYVETPEEAPDRIDAEAQRHLLDNIEKARELGAEVVRLQGADPVAALLDFARSHGVGHIIIGRSHQPWWRQLLGRSVPMRLVREADGLRRPHRRARRDEDAPMTLRAKLLLAQAAAGAGAGRWWAWSSPWSPSQRWAQRRRRSSRTTTAACSPRSG